MTYYRLHRAELAEFGPNNAWSGPWGETYAEDGTQYECRTCDGAGQWLGEPCPEQCEDGWIPADRGYSCCHTAADLLAYVDQHIGTDADTEPVVIFDGEYAGSGLDGEPLAIPTQVIRWTTIAQLRQEIA